MAETVVNQCRIEPDWSTVPDDAVRIVSTKAAELQVVEDFLRDKDIRSYKALDYVQNGAVWAIAGDRVTRALNHSCYEYDICRLYVGATVRMTYNHRINGVTVFSQGQLAVIMQLPDESKEFMNQRIRLRLVPPGAY